MGLKLKNSYDVGKTCDRIDFYGIGLLDGYNALNNVIDLVGLGLRINFKYGESPKIEFYSEDRHKNIFCNECEYISDTYDYNFDVNVYCECPETFIYKTTPIRKDITKCPVNELNKNNDCKFFKKRVVEEKGLFKRLFSIRSDNTGPK